MFFGEKDKINIQIKENMTDKYNRFNMKIQKQVDKQQKPIYKYTKLLNRKKSICEKCGKFSLGKRILGMHIV